MKYDLLYYYSIQHNVIFYVDEDGYFGQEQVPLTDEIKEILDEYPDGQIFKVSNCNMHHKTSLI